MRPKPPLNGGSSHPKLTRLESNTKKYRVHESEHIEGHLFGGGSVNFVRDGASQFPDLGTYSFRVTLTSSSVSLLSVMKVNATVNLHYELMYRVLRALVVGNEVYLHAYLRPGAHLTKFIRSTS
jgi:hypothetical protein